MNIRGGTRGISRVIGTGFGLLIAVGCIALALPLLRNALIRLPGDPLLPAVTGFEPLAGGQRSLFAESRRSGTPADLRELGRMLLADPAEEDPQARRARLTEAIGALESALARSPADSFAWADLSLARLRRDGPTPAGLAALRLSIATAPGEPALSLWRVAMLLDHEPLFGPGDQDLIRQQIRTAWTIDPGGVTMLLEQRDRMDLLRDALPHSGR